MGENMVKVTLELFATLREEYKTKRVDIICEPDLHKFFEAASRILGSEFLSDIYEDHANKVFRADRLITVNGRNIKDMKKIPALKDDDVVAVFPPIAGG
jgi:molybdopterin synthase sulfur carrier subunit